MAIESYGYPETIAAGDDYAFIQKMAGKQYSAAGHTGLQVTKADTGTRIAEIGSGRSMGKGILVHNTTDSTLPIPAPAGTSQWFAVVINRWVGASPYSSTISAVAGSTARAIPALTTSDGGSLDQDPIALCRVTNSSTLIQEVVDLRVISTEGAGFYVVHSDLAQNRLDDVVGAEVYRTDVKRFYKRIVDPNGVKSWKNMDWPDEELSGTAATSVAGPGWARQTSCKMVREGKHRSLVLDLNRTGGVANAFTSNGKGGLGDILLAELHSVDKPPSGVVVPLVGRVRDESASPSPTYGCFGHITSDGDIYLNSMLPDVTVSAGDQVIVTGEWYTG